MSMPVKKANPGSVDEDDDEESDGGDAPLEQKKSAKNASTSKSS